MNNKERNIYTIIIIILAIVITAGTTYIIMSNKNNDVKEEVNDTNKENENSKENENNNNESDKEEKPITLSEYELNKYLSYVPSEMINHEGNCNYIYCNSKTIATSLNEQILLGNTLLNLITDQDEGETIASFDTVNQKMQEMYNLKLQGSYKNSYNGTDFVGYAATYGSYGFSYNESTKTFSYNFISEDNLSTSYIDNYQATENELIIYSYIGIYSGLYGENKVQDIYSNKEYTINKTNTEGYLDDDIVLEYLKNNKTNFTKYKHTFKKNDTGYYWYQTEIVK